MPPKKRKTNSGTQGARRTRSGRISNSAYARPSAAAGKAKTRTRSSKKQQGRNGEQLQQVPLTGPTQSMDIWLVGSSIVYWAYRRARARLMPNLNFHDQGYRLQWFGQRGMHWHELVPKLQKLIEHRIPPKYLVIHLGGNDLTSLSSTELCSAIASQIAELHQWLCHTTIIWSDILPRFQWWGSIVPRAIDEKRKRVNRAGRRAAAVHSGRIIQHVELTTDTPGFFRDDGVHLSDVGNDFFLNTLQGALETFISSDTIIFS